MIRPTCPTVDKDGRYSVTETAKALGIHRNSLKRYTDQGLIKCIFNRLCSRKLYTGVEIVRFWHSMM